MEIGDYDYETKALDCLVDVIEKAGAFDIQMAAAQSILQHVQYLAHLDMHQQAREDAAQPFEMLGNIMARVRDHQEDVAGVHEVSAERKEPMTGEQAIHALKESE